MTTTAPPRKAGKKVQQIAFERELGFAFGRYAEKVILDRAIPDLRDGLKPVQRRIVYAMYEAGNRPDKPYRKSAKTVGDVMGNYHPHGDTAIYDALVRLAQPWKMRYPLVDGHGNFGSMDDDPAAAMRYTEARLSPIALELLLDIEADTVPWKPNFDEKTVEPVVLPAGLPNLLANGASGVSAGFATEIPSHNLGELVDAALALLHDPELTLDGAMAHVTGPDFPTGGVLMGADGLREAYDTGRGKVVLRARHDVERERDGKSLLVFTEIPFNVVKSDLVRQIDAIRLDKSVQGLADVRDESDREGLRIVVELARGADLEGVLAYLLKKTQLQINYHFNMVVIDRNTPKLVGLLDVLRRFVEHRRDVVRRRSKHDLDKAEHRLHEVEGLIRAVDILDEVIATIRRSQDRPDARRNLEAMGFSTVQADAILDLRLARLTNLQILELEDERDELTAFVGRLRAILADPAVCDAVVEGELLELRNKYADDRRTTIQEEVERLDVALEVLVKPQDVVVGVTEGGWIKRASYASFQATGGDRKKAGVAPGDRMHDLVFTNTTHNLLVFGEHGVCYPLPVHKIPETRWGDVGSALVSVCGFEKDARVVAALPRADFPDDRFLLFVTAEGRVKATPLSEFASSRSTGIVALKLAEGDLLAGVLETDLQGDLILMSRAGKGIRFGLSEVSVQGRAAAGVWGMRSDPDDPVTDAVPIATPAPSDLYVTLFTESGMAKRTALDQVPAQRRGGKGLRMVVHKKKDIHRCAAIHISGPEDRFQVVDSHGGEHVLEAARIPITVRDGRAFSLVPLKAGARVVLVENLGPEPVEPIEAGAGAAADPAELAAVAETVGAPHAAGAAHTSLEPEEAPFDDDESSDDDGYDEDDE